MLTHYSFFSTPSLKENSFFSAGVYLPNYWLQAQMEDISKLPYVPLVSQLLFKHKQYKTNVLVQEKKGYSIPQILLLKMMLCEAMLSSIHRYHTKFSHMPFFVIPCFKTILQGRGLTISSDQVYLALEQLSTEGIELRGTISNAPYTYMGKQKWRNYYLYRQNQENIDLLKLKHIVRNMQLDNHAILKRYLAKKTSDIFKAEYLDHISRMSDARNRSQKYLSNIISHNFSKLKDRILNAKKYGLERHLLQLQRQLEYVTGSKVDLFILKQVLGLYPGKMGYTQVTNTKTDTYNKALLNITTKLLVKFKNVGNWVSPNCLEPPIGG